MDLKDSDKLFEKDEEALDDNDKLFKAEPEKEAGRQDRKKRKGKSDEVWKILIVDDEEDVHVVTKMALRSHTFLERTITFLDTYSAKETIPVLKKHTDIALILLDVVMETNNAGLELVKYIRKNLSNTFTQIILRTGYPGQAPERDVIVSYDINDYKTKTELTALKLFTSVLAGIRSYASIMEVENYRRSLEDKVKERTKELAEKNLSITSSISYAGRIQNALLPLREEIDGLLPSWFILNKPRDIVSGDFYWIARKREKIVVAVGDCTGHGVPGAFMSILGISTLNEVVSKSEYLKPDEILNRVREQVIRSLHQTGRDDETRDGIEIALCVFDFPKKKLQFSGAFRPLYLVRDNSLQEFKGDFMPIGIYDDKERPFSSKELDLKENDTIYLFSDGYVDQIGGPDRKTFRAKKFKQLLTDIHREPINEQKEILEKKHEEWKGNMVQIDDILVLGIRFSER